MREKRINELGDTFVARNMRRALKITFDNYLVDPGHYDHVLSHMELKGGLMTERGSLKLVHV